jgi:hypothetical protein
MKLAPSNRTLAVLFIVVLVFSGVNTFFIVFSNNSLQSQRNQDLADQNRALDQTYRSLNETDYIMQNLLNGKIDNVDARLPVGQYDHVIYRFWDYNSNVSVYMLKNGRNGIVEYNSTDAASVLNHAFIRGNAVFVVSDEYSLNSDVLVSNKKNARLDSDGAILTLNGNKIIIRGQTYQNSQYDQVSGFKIVNGSVRVENSFFTTITNMIFENCSVGIELANTNLWTEGTKIDAIHFNKCSQGIVFRTNISDVTINHYSTGSYGNTEIARAYFNQLDNSAAITVERNAEFTNGLIQNVRIWIGEFGKYNQTGLQLNANSSMYQTLMDDVVFESFALKPLENASIYGIKMDLTNYGAPVLHSGVSFLGIWTARINNLYDNWILSGGSIFKQENISINVNPFQYPSKSTAIQMSPATISSFKPKITVQGNFIHNETVVVRFRLEFVDNAITSEGNAVEKSFNSSSSLWLSDEDLMQLFPSQNMIYAILVDAKVSSLETDASARIDLYGLTT